MSFTSRSMTFSASIANDDISTGPIRRRNPRLSTSQALALPIPEWWRVDYMRRRLWPGFAQLESIIFQLLCVVAFGKTDMCTVWEDTLPGNEEHFKQTKDQLTSQVSNTNIISGLVLATTAVFLTTASPREDMLQFDIAGPYVCLLASFGLAMGSMICGSALQLIAGRCTPRWMKMNLTSTRFRLMLTLGLIGYPLISVGLAGTLCGVGLSIAAMRSPHRYIQAGAIVVIALPYIMFTVFLWLALVPSKEEYMKEDHHTHDHNGTGAMSKGTREATETPTMDDLEKGQA